jgi:hypothetical protein
MTKVNVGLVWRRLSPSALDCDSRNDRNTTQRGAKDADEIEFQRPATCGVLYLFGMSTRTNLGQRATFRDRLGSAARAIAI